MRRGAYIRYCAVHDWERWDHFAEEWQPIAYEITHRGEAAVRQHVANLYSLRPKDVRVVPLVICHDNTAPGPREG